MQCVLQFPTVEMITQKETRGEFYLHELFNSFPVISCVATPLIVIQILRWLG